MNTTYLSLNPTILMLAMYDEYIRYANKEESYKEGWRPVCIDEFKDMEFEDYLQNPDEYELALDEELIKQLNELDSANLLRLNYAYNCYIQTANDISAYELQDGNWQPVSLRIFLKESGKDIFQY